MRNARNLSKQLDKHFDEDSVSQLAFSNINIIAR